MVKLKPYQQGDYELLLKDIRDEDREEIEAMGMEPKAAVMDSIRSSNVLGVYWDDDRLICIFGVTPVSVLTGTGIAWIVGTTHLKPKHIVKYMYELRGVMLSRYSHLFNLVYHKNKSAIATLKHTGFKVYPPQPAGPKHELFHRFELRV